MDIRELARLSGVSVATVSRALNGRPDVSARTRERVVAMARELGYRPNQQARSLVRRRSGLLGLLWDTGYAVNGARHPFLADVLLGLKTAVAGTGYHLMLVSTPAHEDGTHPTDASAGPSTGPSTGASTGPAPDGAADLSTGDQGYVQAARQHGLEGVVLMGVDEQAPAIRALLASGRPCLGIDLPVAGPAASYVTSDNRSGAAAAVAHLHALGHRRIATITGPLGLLPATERLAGYRYQCARAGLPHRPEYVESGDFFLSSGYACMRRLLALPDPPTAVFVAGDEMAVGALHAAADAGRRVPQDVSVIGYDDVDAASLVRPTLTTVAQDRMALAAAAVDGLIRLIDAKDAHDADGADGGPVAGGPRDVGLAPRLLPTRLVVRNSCGPVSTG